jgi:hypothetical protein
VTNPIPDWWESDHELAQYLTSTYGSLQQAADVLAETTTRLHAHAPVPWWRKAARHALAALHRWAIGDTPEEHP